MTHPKMLARISMSRGENRKRVHPFNLAVNVQ